jgi:hypothetical protein
VGLGNPFTEAFDTRDVERFLALLFPPTWAGLTARIVESGVEFSDVMCPWAPRWSRIPPTVRRGADVFSTEVKSCLFRVHDCLHQLWGLPIPGQQFTEDDFYLYKRSQMCGEVAVLTLTEFIVAQHFYDTYPSTQALLWSRNAIPMLKGPLRGKSPLQIALRMDDVLHKKRRPKWVRDHEPSTAFCDDYVPMLEYDRLDIDHNWALMKRAAWTPFGAPDARYSRSLDGLELTTWMITDFYHQMDTDPSIDTGLRDFNRLRRQRIVLPAGWGLPKP